MFATFCILDFEATCDDEKKFRPSEIIEFPSVLIKTNLVTGESKIIGEFQQYCKPVINPILTKFCTQLTGITQDVVDAKGVLFQTALQMHQKWLASHVDISETVYFLTCGNWDLNVMLPLQAKLSKLEIPSRYKKFINIKQIYDDVYKKSSSKGKFKLGMAGMLREQGIELVGRHHSGIDDCKNLTTLVIHLFENAVKQNIGIQHLMRH